MKPIARIGANAVPFFYFRQLANLKRLVSVIHSWQWLGHLAHIGSAMGLSVYLFGCQSIQTDLSHPQQAKGLPVHQAAAVALSKTQAQALATQRANAMCNAQQVVILKQDVSQYRGSSSRQNNVFGRVGSVVGNIFGQPSYRPVSLPEYRVTLKFQCQ